MVSAIAGDKYVIDLHCDTLTECNKRRLGYLSNEELHFSFDRVPGGMRWCQCMAVFMPDELRDEEAERYFDEVCAVYERQGACCGGIAQVEDPAGILQALKNTRYATILTVEGGSALAGKLENLSKMYARGVRMMTLTWNAANEIAGGADTDAGFTPFGRQVVAEMERLGMAVDVSHLSDRAFWELCEFAGRPFAASHSNARAVCAHRRNLTDEMFREIVRRGGVVGMNYYDLFIKEGGDSRSVDDLARHVLHFLELGGEDTLALGSDFDGADIPYYLAGVEHIGCLTGALERFGVPAQVVDKILFANASRFFRSLAAGEARAGLQGD